MNRDDLIREMTNRRGTWQGLLVVYVLIVATMVGSAMTII